ncbi:MAG TPA: HAMP domain-containing sensor histidine kinase [Actinomycetota bacterium]|nr:HAMP domain-containing sensor histidine kinase [Actinomycetota bacterium]
MGGPPRAASSVTQPLLDAVARALGARRAYLALAGTKPPVGGRAGVVRRRAVHHLAVDVPDLEPAQQLVLELAAPPAPADRLVAEALARVFSARRRPGPPPGPHLWDPTPVLNALTMPEDRRPEAMLRAALVAARARSGALVTSGPAARTWTLGGDGAAIRRAAAMVLEGETGRVEVGADRFLGLPVVRHDRVVGAFVAHEGSDGPGVRASVALIALALPSAPEDNSPASTGRDDLLRAALAPLRSCLVLLDGGGRLLAASPPAETLFGLTDFDQGQGMDGRLGDLDVSALVAGGPLPREMATRDTWMELSANPLPAGGYALVFSDRAPTAEEQENQAALVAAMSHELRTPIAGMKALMEVLRMVGPGTDPDRIAALLREGIHEAGRLERLVEDLLLTARVATGGIRPVPDRVELRPIAESVVALLGPRYPETRFTVTGVAGAHADPALVRHAVWHLADNAAKFGPPGGSVELAIEEGPDGPLLSVTDEGPGVYSGDIPDLFRRFHRMERNAKSQHGGAGVGLYLVKAVMEAQGGRVEVRSRLGKGSTFSLRFACAPPD